MVAWPRLPQNRLAMSGPCSCTLSIVSSRNDRFAPCIQAHAHCSAPSGSALVHLDHTLPSAPTTQLPVVGPQPHAFPAVLKFPQRHHLHQLSTIMRSVLTYERTPPPRTKRSCTLRMGVALRTQPGRTEQETLDSINRPDPTIGFIVLRPGHAYTIKQHGPHWYIIDSLAQGPRILRDADWGLIHGHVSYPVTRTSRPPRDNATRLMYDVPQAPPGWLPPHTAQIPRVARADQEPTPGAAAGTRSPAPTPPLIDVVSPSPSPAPRLTPTHNTDPDQHTAPAGAGPPTGPHWHAHTRTTRAYPITPTRCQPAASPSCTLAQSDTCQASTQSVPNLEGNATVKALPLTHARYSKYSVRICGQGLYKDESQNAPGSVGGLANTMTCTRVTYNH